MGLFHLLQFKFINNDSKCQEFIRRTFQVKKNEPDLSSFENLYPLYHTRCNLPIPKTKKNDGSGVPVNILLLHKVKLQQK